MDISLPPHPRPRPCFPVLFTRSQALQALLPFTVNCWTDALACYCLGVLRGRSSGIGHGVLRGTRIRLSLDNRGQCGFLPNVSKRSSGRLHSSPEDRLSHEHLKTNSLTLQMQKLAVRGDGGTRSRVTVEIGAVPSATL